MLREAVRRHEPFAISAVTLLELALLVSPGSLKTKLSLDEVFREVEESPACSLLPLTYEIAREVASMGPSLRDPADRVIVATARVHGLRLLTSDQRIIESAVVSVVE
jgi:PIN domain nuclease of toxin-antitoxin system